MSKTAAELIAHLESGGLIVRGEPNHAEFLRFEMYESGERVNKHLGMYGWGSALGSVESRLVDVLENPHRWVCIPAGKNIDDHEASAKPLLEQLGQYEDYDWVLVVKDERPTNT